jgi:hypothetical protein
MTLTKAKILGALKSKTMWFSGALAILGALLDNITYVQGFMTPHDYNLLFIFVSLVVAGLRWITTNALEDKQGGCADTPVTPVAEAPIIAAPVEPKITKTKPKAKPKAAAKTPAKPKAKVKSVRAK